MCCNQYPFTDGKKAVSHFRKTVFICILLSVILLFGCSGKPEDSSGISISQIEGNKVSLKIADCPGGVCKLVARDQKGEEAGAATVSVAEGENSLQMELTPAELPAMYELQAYLLDEQGQTVYTSQPEKAALRSDKTSSSRVSGIFIAPELASEATQEQWGEALSSMKELGIDTVIVQYSLQQDPKRGNQAYFPYKEADTVSGADRYPLRRQQLEYILSAAADMDLDVFLGLQLAEEEWFHQNMYRDEQWLREQYQLSVKVADELWSVYGEKYGQCIAGWYLPFELESDEEYYPYFEQITETYYTPLTTDLKSSRDYGRLDLMISPTMYRADDVAAWEKMMNSLLCDSQIDILAPQDGIGYGTQTHNSLEEWFQAARAAVDSASAATGRKIALWGNCENYARLQDQNDPKPIDRIKPMSIRKFIDSMDIAAPYVDKLITFSLHRWDVSLEDSSAVDLNRSYYEAYRRFCSSGVKPLSKAEGYYVEISTRSGASPILNAYATGGLTDGFAADTDNWKEYLGVKTSEREPFIMEIAFDDPVEIQRIVSNYYAKKKAAIALPRSVQYEYFVRSHKGKEKQQYFPFYQESFSNKDGVTRSTAAVGDPVKADGIRITVTPGGRWTFLDEIWVE